MLHYRAIRCLLVMAGALLLPTFGVAAPLPAGTDFVVTVNVRQFLADHQGTDAVQKVLEPWRLAMRGDEAALRKLWLAHPPRDGGISEPEYLAHARALKALGDALGLDPLQDVHRLTLAMQRAHPESWVVVLEGRFANWRGKESTPAKDGIALALLNRTTLVLAGRKESLDAVAAAGKKADAPSAERRALLEQSEKHHLAIFFDHVDGVLSAATIAALQKSLDKVDAPEVALARYALTQAESWTGKYGKDIVAVQFGVSVDAKQTRLQLGLLARHADAAKAIAEQLNGTRALGALTARFSKQVRTRQAGDVLLHSRVVAAGSTVQAEVPVPHAFVAALAADAPTAIPPLLERLARQLTSIPIWQPLPPVPGSSAVDVVRDVAYRSDADADPLRHRLDLYLPHGKKDAPVLVLVHGGGWVMGDNRCAGLYSSVGHFFASQGYAVVVPNYRLSPAVTHPEHARDVAKAIRWTRDHIGEHGGNSRRLFLMGHSAGGHLVALVAADPSYLQAEGLSTKDLRGVVAISGVYRILADTMDVLAGGDGGRSFRPDQVFPLRGGSTLPPLPPLGIRVSVDVFGPAFRRDPKECHAASPLSHVRRDLPPLLIVTAANDLPGLRGMATEFHKALTAAGAPARLLDVADRNHNSVIFSMLSRDDPAARAVLEFLAKCPPSRER